MHGILEFIGNTTDGVCAVDGAQRIALWNQAAESLLGHKPDEVIGKHCYAVLGGSDEAGCEVCTLRCDAIRSAARMEIVATRDLQIRARDGHDLWVNMSTASAPNRWDRHVALIHIFRDVSPQRALERETRRLVAESALSGSPSGTRRADATPAFRASLTERELQVLALLATGASTTEISSRLSISTATVRNHVHHVLDKLGVHSRLEAATLALRHGLL